MNMAFISTILMFLYNCISRIISTPKKDVVLRFPRRPQHIKVVVLQRLFSYGADGVMQCNKKPCRTCGKPSPFWRKSRQPIIGVEKCRRKLFTCKRKLFPEWTSHFNRLMNSYWFKTILWFFNHKKIFHMRFIHIIFISLNIFLLHFWT